MTTASSQQATASARRALPPGDEVRASFEFCRRFTRRRAENFYFGMKLTPEPKRSALYAIYAFMCACDDLADEALNTQNAQAALQRIEEFRARMEQVIAGPTDSPLPHGAFWPAFRHVMTQYPIDPCHLHDMLDGQRMDLTTNRYETFEQLYDYCYKVASTVGLVCISVWGHNGGNEALKMAEHRGIALQMTNILRDVVEDASRDRVYLPLEDLRQFDLDPDTFPNQTPPGQFDRFMAFQLERADAYYQRSAGLDRLIDPACRSTSWAIMRIYRSLFEKIRANPRRVLEGRTRLSKLHKVAVALTAWMRGSRV